jgi:hypothetical protein
MRRIDEFVLGLTILAEHDGSKGFGVGAEHDEIFVAVEREPSKQDCVKLKALGWHPENEKVLEDDEEDENRLVWSKNT